ncbi:MAG: T9SS type A sorting domain-containing protein [Candidatus Cloacimonetes bacterium]|nr:T9SS type A sorting domain-containing protein [Candidatus Cloacimonadota bacterium]
MKKITLIIIILACITLLSALENAVAPKMVYIQISRDGTVPPEGTITFTCNLVGNTLIKLTSNSPNCGYFPVHGSGYGVIYADVTQLYHEVNEVYYNWQPANELRFAVVYDNEPQYANFNVFHTLGDGCFESSAGIEEFIPLAVTLSSFTAVYHSDQVELQWITQSETSNAGWNVYRCNCEAQEEALQVNPELIPGHGTCTEPQQYSFKDAEVETGTTCYYWLESVDYSGSNQTYGPIELQIPEDGQGDPPPVDIVYGLHDAYPNPFNPETTINFVMEQPGKANLAIFNIKGQKVVTLYDDFVNTAGEPVSIHWDGKDSNGRDTGSGIYFYQFRTTGKTQVKKMVLVK